MSAAARQIGIAPGHGTSSLCAGIFLDGPTLNTEEQTLGLIGLAYEAALDPSRWTEFLDRTAQACNARSGLLRMVDYDSGRVGLFETVGYDPAYVAAYRDYYVRLDPYAEKWTRAPQGALMTTEQAVSWKTRRKTAFHNEYERPQGVRHAIGCVLAKNDGHDLQFSLQRGPQADSFDDDSETLSILAKVMPHLGRAVRVHRSLQEAGIRANWALEALNRLRCGVIVTDARGHARHINRAADSLLSQSPGVRFGREGLSLPLAQETEQFRRLIHAAANLACGAGAALPGDMRVSLQDGGALQLQVVPLLAEKTRWHSAFPHGTLAIFITRPGQPRLPWKQLVVLHGLTPAEAKLAAKLAEGQSLEEAADMLSISIHTARCQLKAAFQKTGVRRQSELVALLLTGVLSHCADNTR